MRGALSIFDQIVSLSGKMITYKDVIENLNVLDFEYYFSTIDGALRGDVSSVLLTFNEILEKGFDGHNFVSGLCSHLRDLLVAKDEITLKLLEATPSVKQRYLQQTRACTEDFIFKALEHGNNCDVNYKTSKNQRLHVELFLIRLCRITEVGLRDNEKKKHEPAIKENIAVDLPLPSKSEIIRESTEIPVAHGPVMDEPLRKHTPVIEKHPKSFSIKDIISEEKKNILADKPDEKIQEEKDLAKPSEELNGQTFGPAWNDFVDQLKPDGPRILSMFKSVTTEVENDRITLHLSNAAQKDIFVLNYKQRLVSFLNSRFKQQNVDIETEVDLSESNDILYSDEQKYNYLVNKYPDLKEFKKSFNLDIQ
jgi:DNA polymerase-3 subunit gamma/tau